MPTTIRQLIVNEIIARLELITVANGYQTDLGSGPINEWPVVYQEDELPALGVFDLTNVVIKEFSDEKRLINRLPIQVRIFLPREPTPATVRNMLADVQKAVVTDPETGARDFTLRGLAVDMLPEEDGFVVPSETFQIDGAAVGFVVQF